MINFCTRCLKDFTANYKSNICEECHKPILERRELGMPVLQEVVYIKDYGKELKSRVTELRRREVIKDKSCKGSEYFVGRRRDDGKIEEKEPDY